MKFTKTQKVKTTKKVGTFKKGTEVHVEMVDKLSNVLLKYFIQDDNGVGCWCTEGDII